MKGPFEVVGSPPSVEAWELEETVSEKDLALADSILARLMVRLWASQRSEESARNSTFSLDNHGPVSPHVAGHG